MMFPWQTFQTVEETLQYVDASLNGLDLYEFGVFQGKTLYKLLRGFNDKDVSIRKVFGFDSFEGLPEEKEGLWQNPDWPAGAFNAQNIFDVDSKDKVEQILYEKLLLLHDDVELITGWFSDTLNQENFLKFNMGRAAYIHIDTDLHISSFQALEFCFSNKIPQYGTIIRYDDILSTPINAGQHLAHNKIKHKYGVVFEQLSYNVFRVISYE